MFTIRKSELILPTGWEYRGSRRLGLAPVLCNALIDLRSIQIECNQILAVGVNDLAKQFVPVINIPVHQLKEFCKEELTRYLPRSPSPTRDVTPGECISL